MRYAASSSDCSRCRTPPQAPYRARPPGGNGRAGRVVIAGGTARGRHSSSRQNRQSPSLAAGIVRLAGGQFQPRHGQHKARIDSVLALRDAMAAAGAHRCPYAPHPHRLPPRRYGQHALGELTGLEASMAGGRRHWADFRTSPACDAYDRAPAPCGSSSRDRGVGRPLLFTPRRRSSKGCPMCCGDIPACSSARRGQDSRWAQIEGIRK